MEILIIICGLLLFSYLADISAQKTKIPSIVFLISLGLGLKELMKLFYPEFDLLFNSEKILPVLGNLGLIMIVLEGAIDLEISRKKVSVVSKAIIGSCISILAVSAILSYLLIYLSNERDFKTILINVVPLSIISSAIAIPATRYMHRSIREYVIYESSISDIIGVLIFYFLVLNSAITVISFLGFTYDVIIMFLISLLVSVLLSLFLSQIKHHVKFLPIIIIVVMIYSISKMYHLPSLILILIFGLTLKNLEKLSHFQYFSKLSNFFHPEVLNRELKKFEDVVNEFSFLVRTAFFIIFGYSLNVEDILNFSALQWSLLSVGVIYLIRLLVLWILKIEFNPIFLIAPRGLVSILLFISIPSNQRVQFINQAVLVQVVVLSTLLMMIGNIFYKQK